MLPSLAGHWARAYSSNLAKQLNVCIVGSGPAGFYTADKVGEVKEATAILLVAAAATDALHVMVQLLKGYGDNIKVDIVVSVRLLQGSQHPYPP